MVVTGQNGLAEFSFTSSKRYGDPFNEVTLEAVFTDPKGDEHRVPAFWAGEQMWRMRYASPKVGVHRWRSVCSDESNAGLHGREGTLEVVPYEGANPLLKHGRLRMAEDRRHLEHVDGTPFFWLGDTWWFGLVKRLTWPGDFQRFTADRVAKGFNLVQLVAGLYPDVYQFDPRGENEAGCPWTEGYRAINPAYFDMMDLRIEWLVRSGIVPCIVGAWGYYIKYAGPEVMKKHWRNLVARYGAYPAVWCVAGEAVMHFYTENFGPDHDAFAHQAWTDVMRYLRETDPYHNPITIHPTWPDSRAMINDASLLDVDMLQTGHGYNAMEGTVKSPMAAFAGEPPLPVIDGEPMYEGIMGGCWHDLSRFCFWTCMMSGAAGHTYGANGIWQMSTPEEPCVAISGSWGDTTWEEASRLAGSAHVGVGRRIMERFPWWRFRPRVEPEWDAEERISPLAAGIPGEVWMFYLASEGIARKFHGMMGKPVRIEAGAKYRAKFISPRDGHDVEIGPVEPDAEGLWRHPRKPSRDDWVLVLEGQKARQNAHPTSP
jgi:hypothetical protein